MKNKNGAVFSLTAIGAMILTLFYYSLNMALVSQEIGTLVGAVGAVVYAFVFLVAAVASMLNFLNHQKKFF